MKTNPSNSKKELKKSYNEYLKSPVIQKKMEDAEKMIDSLKSNLIPQL
jgi:hypothetical protein